MILKGSKTLAGGKRVAVLVALTEKFHKNRHSDQLDRSGQAVVGLLLKRKKMVVPNQRSAFCVLKFGTQSPEFWHTES